MKKLLFAIFAVTLLAVPAMASVQSVKVSGDIESTYLIRNNFDLTNYEQSVLFTQTRLRVDSDLTDKVSATIAMINERVWGENDSASSDIDLNLAYVTMKEMLYSPLTVTLGRQEFAFGNSFVVDSRGSNNTAPTDSGLNNVAEDLTKQTAKDALRLNFDYDPLTIDVLYAAIDQNTVTGAVDSDDTDLYGVNVGYQFNNDKNTMVEGYFWAQDEDSTDNKIYMPGARVSTNITDSWIVQAEAAMQLGTYSPAGEEFDREAFAGQLISNYMLPIAKAYQPVLGVAYSYYSGDSDSSTGDYDNWDPMYENQGTGKIANALFNASNSHVLGANLSIVPAEDFTANLYYDYLWMDKNLSSAFTLIQPDGTAATPSQDTDETELGHEVGLVLTYDYTEDVQFGARAGWFLPGQRFEDTETDDAASQLLLNAKVAF
ncbi:MAG: alginate export family protein [Candidatus Omnitrophota bacterium]